MKDKQKKGNNNKIFLFIAAMSAVLAFLILMVMYVFFSSINKQEQQASEKNKTKNGLTGKIYLSLAPKISNQPGNVTTKNPPVGIYAFNFNSGKLEKYFSGAGEENDYNLRFSADGSKAAFVSNRQDPDKGYSQVFILDSGQGNIKNLTSSDITDKQLPTWSPNGKLLAYTQLSDSPNPEVSSVRIVDMEGNDRFLTWGAYPLFSPDGKQVLVLKEKGLFLVDVNDGKSEGPVAKLCSDAKCQSSVKINVSPDKKYLAWTNSSFRELNVHKIESWVPFQSSLIKKVSPVASFWPVFSPDGNYLAFQEVETVDNTAVKMSLVVYNLNSWKKQIVTDMSQYNSSQAWVTDWQK